MKRNATQIIVALSMVSSSVAWGGDYNYQATSQPTTQATSQTGQNVQTGTSSLNKSNPNTINTDAVNAQIKAAQTNLSNNALKQGQNAEGKQNSGMLQSLAGAAMSAAMAASSCSRQPIAPDCPIWILSAVTSLQASQKMDKAKGQSAQTVGDVSTGGTDSTKPTGSLYDNPTYKDTVAKLDKLSATVPGLKVDTKTGKVTLPDGRQISQDDLKSGSSAAAAGLSSGDMKALGDALNKALAYGEKNPAKGIDSGNTASGYEEGGGSGGSSSSKSTASNDGFGGRGPAKSAVNRDPSQVAGLSKDYNGSPIGVANDDLFKLINRRYDFKAQNDTFLLSK